MDDSKEPIKSDDSGSFPPDLSKALANKLFPIPAITELPLGDAYIDIRPMVSYPKQFGKTATMKRIQTQFRRRMMKLAGENKPPLEGFLLVDIETTGLEPEQGFILEIGMAHCDLDFNLLDMFQTLVVTPETMKYLEEEIQKDKFIYDMHDKSGLLGEIDSLHGTSMFEEVSPEGVSAAITDWMSSIGNYGKVPWTGSSVHFDKQWMEAKFRDVTEAHFTYRTIDASGFREYLKVRRPEVYLKVLDDTMDARKEHRVTPDILDTIDLFKSLQKHGVII